MEKEKLTDMIGGFDPYDLSYKGVKCFGVCWKESDSMFLFRYADKVYLYQQTSPIYAHADTDHIRTAIDRFLESIGTRRMKAGDLARKLLEHPDFDVAFSVSGPDGSDYGFGVRTFADIDVADIGYSSKTIILSGEEKK